ncbi:MAG: cytochrome c-type biogenesis protein CcmH [Pseudomonadota bacterium]|nr:cytochrome c-type biogenesis protein CcmH [Pseudomonadota bacterium]
MRLLLLAVALGGAAFAQAPAEAPAPPVEAPAADAAPARAAIDPSDLIGSPAGPPLTGAALKEQTHAVSKLLRCPVCQGLSVADSRAESALAMKAEVEDLVAQGYDTEQILLYFEASYGEFIRLEPKFEGVNVLVWAAPVLLLVVGAGWVLLSVRAAGRRANPGSGSAAAPTSANPVPTAPKADAPPADAELATYLRRVREENK